MSVEVENHIWLMSAEAKPLLSQTEQQLAEDMNVVRIVTRLRKVISAERSAIVLQLAQLRIRARRKFDQASKMFVTSRGLEMATDQRIARFKAQRFDDFNEVIDVCCGIGGDLIGLALQNRNRIVVGIDKDPLAVLYANANLAAYDLPPTAQLGTFEETNWVAANAVHLDPQRRQTERSIRGDKFLPSLDSLAAIIQDRISAGIKVAPATDVNQTVFRLAEREWIGHHRQCQQQMIWTADLAVRPGCLRAVRLSGDGGVTAFEFPADEVHTCQPQMAATVGKYYYEPHNVLLASKLFPALACLLNLSIVAANVPYFTSDAKISNKLLSRFLVIESLPAHPRQVTKELKRLKIGRLEIKHRGLPDYLTDVYRRIKLGVGEPATLILSPINGQPTAIIAIRQTGV